MTRSLKATVSRSAANANTWCCLKMAKLLVETMKVFAKQAHNLHTESRLLDQKLEQVRTPDVRGFRLADAQNRHFVKLSSHGFAQPQQGARPCHGQNSRS